jgi:hypothetical protein
MASQMPCWKAWVEKHSGLIKKGESASTLLRDYIISLMKVDNALKY